MTTLSLDHMPVALITVLTSFAAHVAVWRSFSPKRQVLWLGVLFLIAPLTYYAFLSTQSFSFDYVAPAFFHALVAANYIAIYPAFQASSPTIRILNVLDRHPEGLAKTELLSFFSHETLVGERLNDLAQSGLIRKEGTTLRLNRSGNRLAGFFIWYRWVLGLPQGSG